MKGNLTGVISNRPNGGIQQAMFKNRCSEYVHTNTDTNSGCFRILCASYSG